MGNNKDVYIHIYAYFVLILVLRGLFRSTACIQLTTHRDFSLSCTQLIVIVYENRPCRWLTRLFLTEHRMIRKRLYSTREYDAFMTFSMNDVELLSTPFYHVHIWWSINQQYLEQLNTSGISRCSIAANVRVRYSANYIAHNRLSSCQMRFNLCWIDALTSLCLIMMNVISNTFVFYSYP
jgi:hypothetical protein